MSDSTPPDNEETDTSDDELPPEPARKPIAPRTLALLAVMGLGGAYLGWSQFKPGPATAIAAASEAQTAVQSFMAGGVNSVRNMETMLRDTQEVVAQFKRFPGVQQVPLDQLKINPFVSPEPPAPPHFDATKPAAPPSESAERLRRDADRAEALRLVQTLNVQSLLVSNQRRSCMINGVMCQEGQTTEGFLVEKISPASVIVKRGPYRFELQLQK